MRASLVIVEYQLLYIYTIFYTCSVVKSLFLQQLYPFVHYLVLLVHIKEKC
jgi:hypothetical protein